MSLAGTTRILIGDNDVDLTKRKWEDVEIDQYVESAIDDFNACPPASDYNETTLPSRFRPIVCQGAIIFGLIAYGTFHINRDFNYSENGLSITMDRHSNANSMLSALGISDWERKKKEIKGSLKVSLGLRSGFTRVPMFARQYWRSKYRGIFRR